MARSCTSLLTGALLLILLMDRSTTSGCSRPPRPRGMASTPPSTGTTSTRGRHHRHQIGRPRPPHPIWTTMGGSTKTPRRPRPLLPTIRQPPILRIGLLEVLLRTAASTKCHGHLPTRRPLFPHLTP